MPRTDDEQEIKTTSVADVSIYIYTRGRRTPTMDDFGSGKKSLDPVQFNSSDPSANKNNFSDLINVVCH